MIGVAQLPESLYLCFVTATIGLARPVVVDEDAGDVGEEILQSLSRRPGETDLVHRRRHHFEPAIPHRRRDSRPVMVHPKKVVSNSLRDVFVRPPEALDEEIREPPLGDLETVWMVVISHNVVSGDPAVECGGKCYESFLAEFIE